MNVVAKHPFVETLVAGGRALPQSPVSWLNLRRSLALERANALSNRRIAAQKRAIW